MQISEDGQFMWNGSAWVPVQQQQMMPPQVQQPQMYANQQAMQGSVIPNQAFGLAPQPMIIAADSDGKRIVPWVGIGLIILGIFLPFIALGPFSISGFEIMGAVAEIMNDFSGGDSVDDLDDDSSLGFTGVMLTISAIMFALSPFFYVLSGIITAILLVTKKSPKLMGIIHISYFGILMICAFLGTIDAGEFGSFSLIDFLGIGFYMSSLGSALFFIDK